MLAGHWTYELGVTGISCGGCESVVEQRVGGLDAIQSVDTHSNPESVVVESEDGLGKAITKRIRNAGDGVMS